MSAARVLRAVGLALLVAGSLLLIGYVGASLDRRPTVLGAAAVTLLGLGTFLVVLGGDA